MRDRGGRVKKNQVIRERKKPHLGGRKRARVPTVWSVGGVRKVGVVLRGFWREEVGVRGAPQVQSVECLGGA